MGFLGFLGKKKEDLKLEMPDMPPPPPQMGDEEAELPAFPESGQGEELALPEIPEIEQPSFSRKSYAEQKRPEEEELNIPELRMPEISAEQGLTFPKPQQEREDEVYRHTPIAPPQMQMPMPVPRRELVVERHEELPRETEITRRRGDVFVSGEDYREIMETIEELLAKQRGKAQEEERDARKEEAQYERMTNTAEELQRSLFLTEKKMFE